MDELRQIETSISIKTMVVCPIPFDEHLLRTKQYIEMCCSIDIIVNPESIILDIVTED